MDENLPPITPSSFQESPKSNTRLIILVSILVISALAAGYYFMYQKPTAINQDIQSKNINAQPIISQSTSTLPSLNHFKNQNLGIEFDYPTKWGEAIIEGGNKESIEIPPCEGPIMKTYAIEGKYYPWGLYTASIKFSAAPIDFYINILDLGIPGLPKEICNSQGDTITPLSIQPLVDSRNVFTNNGNIKFTFDDTLNTAINTGLAGPVYITRYNNKLIWIYGGYTPFAYTAEEKELGEKYIAPCGNDVYNTEKGCGIIAWAQTGKTSEKIRQAFGDMKELVQTFVFIQQ